MYEQAETETAPQYTILIQHALVAAPEQWATVPAVPYVVGDLITVSGWMVPLRVTSREWITPMVVLLRLTR